MIARLSWELCSQSNGITHAEQTWPGIWVFKIEALFPRDAAHKRHSAPLTLQTNAQCTKSLDSYSTTTGSVEACVLHSQKLLHESRWATKCYALAGNKIKRPICPSGKQNDCYGTGEVDFKQLPLIRKSKFCRVSWKAKVLFDYCCNFESIVWGKIPLHGYFSFFSLRSLTDWMTPT